MKNLLIGTAMAVFATGANSAPPEFITLTQVEEFCETARDTAEEVMIARNIGTPQWMVAIALAEVVQEYGDMVEEAPDIFTPWIQFAYHFMPEIAWRAWKTDETTQAFMDEIYDDCVFGSVESIGEHFVME